MLLLVIIWCLSESIKHFIEYIMTYILQDYYYKLIDCGFVLGLAGSLITSQQALLHSHYYIITDLYHILHNTYDL